MKRRLGYNVDKLFKDNDCRSIFHNLKTLGLYKDEELYCLGCGRYAEARQFPIKTKHWCHYCLRQKKNPQFLIFHRRQALSTLLRKIRSGDIEVPERCTDCAKQTTLTPQHTNYQYPLIVNWYCESCLKEWRKEWLFHEMIADSRRHLGNVIKFSGLSPVNLFIFHVDKAKVKAAVLVKRETYQRFIGSYGSAPFKR